VRRIATWIECECGACGATGGRQARVEGLKPDVIILSGGPNSVHVDGAPTVRSHRHLPAMHALHFSMRPHHTRRRRKHHVAARGKRVRGRSMAHAPIATMRSSQRSTTDVHASSARIAAMAVRVSGDAAAARASSQRLADGERRARHMHMTHVLSALRCSVGTPLRVRLLPREAPSKAHSWPSV
jgi:hypothetical protein